MLKNVVIIGKEFVSSSEPELPGLAVSDHKQLVFIDIDRHEPAELGPLSSPSR